MISGENVDIVGVKVKVILVVESTTSTLKSTPTKIFKYHETVSSYFKVIL